ncbi:MAG: DUF3570 domain-containing protein [Pseudomonadales bacterium]|nr:DUF3570 domain-containing protein [Pseudomonadales bacterium]
MQTDKKISGSLLALTAAAMVLPGISNNAYSSEKADKKIVRFQHANYSEKDLSGLITANGEESPRYQISVNQFQLLTPVKDEYDLTLNYLTEEMSGASPMGNVVGRDNSAKLNMSGASIDESRRDLSGNLRYFGKVDAVYGATLGYSSENDYQALSLGVEGEHSRNEKIQTLSWGVGLSFDSLKPTQDERYVRPKKEDKTSYAGVVGFTQVINPTTQFQTGLSLTFLDGYLSDPYKTLDKRPDSKVQFAWTNRFRHYFEKWQSSVHLDYRLYTDDWAMISHTIDLAWFQPITSDVLLVPSIRYYTQSQADFYVVFDDGTLLGDQSSDFRLSPYGAFTTGVKLVTKAGDWKTTISAEFYQSSADYALGKVKLAHPGLMEYALFTMAFEYAF